MAAPTTTSSTQDPISRQESEADNVHALDVSVFKELARKGLIDALNSVRSPLCRSGNEIDLTFDQINGAKTLVLDSSLASPLGLVAEVSLLKVRQ